jgi:predicted DNA-binding transcriptional regulator AlpA
MSKRLLRKRSVLERLDMGDSTLREHIAEGRFPQPDVKLNKRVHLWLESTLDAWVQEQVERTRETEAADARAS